MFPVLKRGVNLHGSRVHQWHVGERHHVSMTAESYAKSGFHIGLIEARESSPGVDRLELRRGKVPVHFQRDLYSSTKRMWRKQKAVLFDAIFGVGCPIEALQFVVQFARKAHGQGVVPTRYQFSGTGEADDKEFTFHIKIETVDRQRLVARLVDHLSFAIKIASN